MVALPSSSLKIKLRRKATHDIENAKAAVMDGVLRIAVPKITIPVVAIPVASGKIEATRRPAEESEVCLKFAVAGYSSNDISIELDAERERLKITGELEDKSSEFERFARWKTAFWKSACEIRSRLRSESCQFSARRLRNRCHLLKRRRNR